MNALNNKFAAAALAFSTVLAPSSQAAECSYSAPARLYDELFGCEEPERPAPASPEENRRAYEEFLKRQNPVVELPEDHPLAIQRRQQRESMQQRPVHTEDSPAPSAP